MYQHTCSSAYQISFLVQDLRIAYAQTDKGAFSMTQTFIWYVCSMSHPGMVSPDDVSEGWIPTKDCFGPASVENIEVVWNTDQGMLSCSLPFDLMLCDASRGYALGILVLWCDCTGPSRFVRRRAFSACRASGARSDYPSRYDGMWTRTSVRLQLDGWTTTYVICVHNSRPLV